MTKNWRYAITTTGTHVLYTNFVKRIHPEPMPGTTVYIAETFQGDEMLVPADHIVLIKDLQEPRTHVDA